jgi:hypothetical protein
MYLGILLKPFNIYSRDVRNSAGRRGMGYRREQFADVFMRYLRD